MLKSEALARWRSLEPTEPLQFMEAIPYKSEGSKYGACGVRIDGTPEFVDAVLSQLKGLLDGENNCTRLELARRPVDGSGIGKATPNKADKGEVCYIRLHVRGSEGARASVVFDRHLHAATKRFAEAKGVR